MISFMVSAEIKMGESSLLVSHIFFNLYIYIKETLNIMFYTWFKKYLKARREREQAEIEDFKRWMKVFDDLLIIEEYEWED